ncbi:unnamed protein product [Clonostachys solani]|uniref:Uncharacterized protein n=1 Tax=Clonostachys solani TaxID=160281 RepID=A0A9N9YZR5_9HYPO|nr:unnamed protein product [Clonostachys solani]
MPELRDPSPIHVRLHPHCGTCGTLFEPGDNITALKYDRNSLITIDARQFPDSDGPRLPEVWDVSAAGRRYQFCRMGYCPMCGVNNESITCHSDCFNLCLKNMQNGDGLRKLWVAATWRYPLAGCPELRLPPVDNVMSYMDCAKEALEWPDLAKLPLELKTDIVKLSGPTAIGRYASVLQLMRELASDQPLDATLPLDNIQSWNRGGKLIVSPAKDGQEIQLIIDAQGLMEIRWVAEPMEDLTVRSDHFLYITGPVEQFSSIKVDFKCGLARLIVPVRQELSLWDSPATPQRRTTVAGDEPSHNYPWNLMPKLPISRFATIDLRRCDGLTFFIVPSGVHAVHAHTPESPDAVEAFERLRLYYDGPVTWFYMPLAADDEVLAVGLRARRSGPLELTPTLLVHLRSGHYVIGPHRSGAVSDVLVQTRGRPVLIYEPSSSIQLVPYINQIAVSPQTGVKAHYRYIRTRPSCPLDFGCLSSAPLEDVVSIDVFRSADNGTCTGMMFTYRDGRQRSLGQCRLGLDVVSTYEKPAKLYHALRPHTTGWTRGGYGAVYVDIATKEHPDLGTFYPQEVGRGPTQFWAHSEMRGVVNFWSKGSDSFLKVDTSEVAEPEEMLEFVPEIRDGLCRVRELAVESLSDHVSDG